LSYDLPGEISFKELLSACLAASRLIRGSQAAGGQVRPAGKAMLNRDDEPVIRFSTDVGASGRGAFYGCNQMRVARLAHKLTSESRTHWGTSLREMAEQHDKHRPANRNMKHNREMDRSKGARPGSRPAD
jgi:hypothetical protein